MTDDLQNARRRRQEHRHGKPAGAPPANGPAGAFGPGPRKKAAINRVMAKVEAAEERRDAASYYAGQSPTPERITMALNLRDLYGPEVDQELGGEEPMVDDWEAGKLVPDFTQVQALAKLTDFPVKFFYLPAPEPITNGWMCGKGGCVPLGEETPADPCSRCHGSGSEPPADPTGQKSLF